MKHTISDFEIIRSKGELFYKNLTEIYCPYFQEKIFFNAAGLSHLKFKQRQKHRSDADQYMRFKLIFLVPEIIKISHTLQGKLETKQFETVKVHSRKEFIFKNVTYYEFIALIQRNRIKVIIKQIENGQKFFWSIIPFWGMNFKTKQRIFHEGNPCID